MCNGLARSRGFPKLAIGLLPALLALTPLASWGQSPFSGRAGLILYVEGDVVLRGRAGNEPSRAQQHLEAGQRIRTGAGRAEVVLAPGLLLGVGENSELEMVKPRHCHVNRVEPQRPAWIPFQAAALAVSHTVNASFRNRLNVSLLHK